MFPLTDIGALRALLSRHGFSFSKSLGQNFLINPSVCPKMADACHHILGTHCRNSVTYSFKRLIKLLIFSNESCRLCAELGC